MKRRLIIIDICRYDDDDNERTKNRERERQIFHLRMSDERVYKCIYTTNYACFFFVKTFYSIRIIVVLILSDDTIVMAYKHRRRE